MQQLTDGNNTFALDLYRRESAQPGNLFFSPYSISTALAMTYAGARGETAQQMAKTLHFPSPQEALPKTYAELTDQFTAIQKAGKIQLNVANSLWCQKGETFLPEFLKIGQSSYHAELRLVDFATDSAGARKEINDWVAQKTQDKIRDLLQSPQPLPGSLMVLCNAIYFKGTWRSTFDPKSTRPAPFFVHEGQSVEAPTMWQKFNFRTLTNSTASLATLPYVGDQLSMVIVLPNQVDGLATLEKNLTAAQLREWTTALDQAPTPETILYLPKFKLTNRLSLARDLREMGMPVAFSGGADFSGINGKRDLFIGDVVHQAYVDVNEQGTEAAAATAVTMMRSALMRNPPVFRVDHPFLFFIRDNSTGAILFIGRVTDPTK